MIPTPTGTMWTLRKPSPAFPKRWKINANYIVESTPRSHIECVRISYFGGGYSNPVRHYTKKRFLELFKEI